MIPAQRKTSSPRIYYSPQSSTHPSALPSPLSSSSHQAMIISHQPFDGQPFYSQPQQPQQHQQSGPQHPPALRIANPAAYHHLQQQKQQSSTTIDPHLLGINQFGGRPQVKQEEHGMDSYSDAFGPLGTDYELGGALDVNDPTSLMSPISSSPLDDPDFGPRSSSSFTPHGSGSLSTSLQSTPYGTPGMAMPPHGHHPNFYSMSMPVHATNGFSTMEQNKLMGSQPSSFSAYGQIPEIIDENSLKQ
ncbi:hypothetical protein DFS34DRAFT_322907 [Phlyctochytrium arcticum]|nr:hypothetical protein DFS34DRAFT_322907 [Phlyctochytrium arcticum]